MQLDKKAGELLKADLEKQGMHFRMQARTEEILGEQDVTGIKLSDGSILKADLVVMAVGIRPYTQVAQASGLEVNKGIVVNDFMQTSDKHVRSEERRVGRECGNGWAGHRVERGKG